MVTRKQRPVKLDEADDRKTISLTDARFRFRWIERDIKEMKEAHTELKDTVDKIDPRVRRIEIMGYIIIVLGITSKVFSAEIADVVKALIGL
jgi:hypothetical protein